MKRLLAASLVILAGLFLAQQADAFFHEIGNWGFASGQRGSADAILLESGHFLFNEQNRKLLKE